VKGTCECMSIGASIVQVDGMCRTRTYEVGRNIAIDALQMAVSVLAGKEARDGLSQRTHSA
jgi:hypothetical protein